MEIKMPALLCTDEQALLMNVKKKNEEEKKVVNAPELGLSLILENEPADTLVSGGNSVVRECVVSSLMRRFAGDGSVFFLHCGNAAFFHKLEHSRFADSFGGVLSLPVDPIAHCTEATPAASLIAGFAADAEIPLSTAGYDMLEFYLDALLKLNGDICLPELRELAAFPPAQVLMALLYENHITHNEFETESERMKISIGEYPAVRRTVRRMAEIFGCLSGHAEDIPSLYSVVSDNRIFALDMDSLDKDKLLLLNSMIHVCTQCLDKSHSRALFVVDNVPKECSSSLAGLLTSDSGMIIKIISCSDVVSVCSGSTDRLNDIWSSVTNKVIFRHMDKSSDAISGMLGICTQWRVDAGAGKVKGGLKLFPEKNTNIGVQADYNARRVEPGEIRALDDSTVYIVTDSDIIVKTQAVS